MEHAQKVVADIVARCKYQDVEVSETLAAFTARMIVHRHKRKLILEKEMAPEDQNFLIDECVRVLLQTHEPWLETVKMQLEFDFCYANLEEELRQKRERKEKAVASLQRTIAALVPTRASDFETLTHLYRQIFTLLMLYATDGPLDKSSPPPDRNVEKEIAAALESVFPRIGLKSFVTMSTEDKRFQLEELMRIVEGIRLFNKELGKGGAGINVSVEFIEENLYNLTRMIKEEVTDTNETCTQYTEVLLHVHHKSFGEGLDPSHAIVQRWQDELSNRRQFLSYLQSLEEDISFSSEKMATMLVNFKNDMGALKNLVGGRTSLPKSQVYPLFEAVSRSWKELLQEHELLQSRSRSLKALMVFKDSFDRSLTEESDFLRVARKSGTIPAEELFERVETFPAESKLRGDSGGNNGFLSSSFRLKSEAKGADDILDDDDDEEIDPNEEDPNGFPIRMPVDSTPEFMQLPLEYQGFCPWTIVERGGLLLPGDPSLGVVQYRNAYHVFVNERALGEFMIHPRRYLQGVYKLGARYPALIYLLRLQDHFPNTNLSSLLKLCSKLQTGTSSGTVHPLLAPPQLLKVDASTCTPTHFVDKHIDYNYDWNEWNLRRKAIKIANLRHCKTVSCQTNLSNFRREVDSQVYLPTDSETQTGKEQGTNPPRVVTYFAGLRGGKVTGSEESKEDPNNDEGEEAQPAVVSYAFEL
ncbi:TPA: hypothetical protein N0F65_005377 [Lagenidium giganteum]|uniref:Cilia- and flagella-associated protein 206 n=1 Tax=Lagenidium giganteum TaxID=4803 RepID=A0AAV2YZK3_9STRA|nr:TPA: hypothetical protein N0F65_005377 [Lagenidium giganteum]